MMGKTVLVTGAAGYIGSAAAKELIEIGYNVIAIDNLSKGLRSLVDKKATFYKVDLAEKEQLEKVFKENKIEGVMHFASYKLVGESMKDAPKYSDNIRGTINLLDLMIEKGIKKIIYSSSAAVYGSPEYTPMDEKHPTNPINYYGFTKLECEKIIQWYAQLHGIKYISLRYFNVVGDAGLNYINPSPQNIFPIIMEVLFGKREKLTIFGNDYSTRDGTCIRDYIDINDLIKAHIQALDLGQNEIINLGTSKGTSVKELVDAVKEAIGKEFKYEFGQRREGDPAVLIASNDKARKLLGWKPSRDIKETIKSAYKAYERGISD
ncbi:UDP-glucose 4-epimerase GalE [Candidatus Woesearchaeota archaeon]|nr:UDP-glucose 4-epimerase GalE [Candidatus Woesearchaeota archaeon]